jgi:hypothetical protein
VLLVENADGQSLPVDVLSRGTREQLFLSVRLALVATFARRGVNLPMVLDDVLVNFDVGRAQKAAEVLSEFAAAGHQLLFFTCHEHIWNMLKALDADCRRLPVRRGQALPEPEPVAAVEPEPLPEPVAAPTKPPRAPAKRKPRRVKTTIVVEQPRDEWFEYPFVERLVAEPVLLPEPLEAPVEKAPAWAEYSFEPSEFTHMERDERRDHAVAYIVGDEADDTASDLPLPTRRRRTIIGGSPADQAEWGDQRSRRQSRRA